MPNSSFGLTAKTLAVVTKDVRVEMRTRYAVNAILMFAVATLAVVSFSVGQSGLSSRLLAALYWIIMLFSAMSGLAQTFIREEETGTALTLRLLADSDPVYIGKLLVNLGLLSVMAAVITPLFFIFTDAPTGNLPAFVVVLVLGVLGLCGATTLIAAIVARASVRGALFAVLSFPILIPLLLILVSVTHKVLAAAAWSDIAVELQFLIAYAVVMITGSVLLFRFVWQE